jgi:hypothetical protein
MEWIQMHNAGLRPAIGRCQTYLRWLLLATTVTRAGSTCGLRAKRLGAERLHADLFTRSNGTMIQARNWGARSTSAPLFATISFGDAFAFTTNLDQGDTMATKKSGGRKPGDTNYSLREKKHLALIDQLKAEKDALKAKIKVKHAELKETRDKLKSKTSAVKKTVAKKTPAKNSATK